MDMLLLFFVIAVGLLAYFARIITSPAKDADTETQLPAELANAELVLAEVDLRSNRHGFIARPDRVYKLPNGMHVPVELKNRKWWGAVQDDVIELSVQRLALSEDRGVDVAMHGWVLVHNKTQGDNRWYQVPLLTEDQLLELRTTYVEIVNGRTRDLPAADKPSKCRTCSHRQRCETEHGSSA